IQQGCNTATQWVLTPRNCLEKVQACTPNEPVHWHPSANWRRTSWRATFGNLSLAPRSSTSKNRGTIGRAQFEKPAHSNRWSNNSQPPGMLRNSLCKLPSFRPPSLLEILKKMIGRQDLSGSTGQLHLH